MIEEINNTGNIKTGFVAGPRCDIAVTLGAGSRRLAPEFNVFNAHKNNKKRGSSAGNVVWLWK